MTVGWKEHLKSIPDLTLSISDHFEENDTVVLRAWSRGRSFNMGNFNQRIPGGFLVRGAFWLTRTK